MPKQFEKEVLKKECNGTINWNFESIAVILLTNSNFKDEALNYLLKLPKVKSFRNILIKVSSEIPIFFKQKYLVYLINIQSSFFIMIF